MRISLKTSHQSRLCVRILLVTAILTSCTPANPRTLPPESYSGPMAEQPLFQKGDFWISRAQLSGAYRNLRTIHLE